MKGVLKGIGITILVIVILLVLAAGYFGLMPGVSKIFGADQPRNLGVPFTEEDRMQGRAKAGWELVELPTGLPPQDSLRYSGQHEVKATFTEKELTAWINKSWNYIPLTDCQIRVNQDNTVEVAGILHTGRLQSYAEAMGAAEEYNESFVKIYKVY
jgi:hypothetical protein